MPSGVRHTWPLKEILKTGYDYSWFVLSQKVIEKEFALSGSEQNPDLTSGKWIEVIKARLLSRGGAPGPDEAFKTHGADFVVADTPEGTFLGGCIFSGRNAGRSKAIA